MRRENRKLGVANLPPEGWGQKCGQLSRVFLGGLGGRGRQGATSRESLDCSQVRRSGRVWGSNCLLLEKRPEGGSVTGHSRGKTRKPLPPPHHFWFRPLITQPDTFSRLPEDS